MNPKNPFPYSFSNKRYHTWDYHLKERFGGKVFKVSLDGGFSCPNIDGTKGKGGCTYCAYSFKRQSAENLLTQFRQGVEALHRKWPDAQQYIPYFQANTNTYAPVSELREKYEVVLGEPGVVGLSTGAYNYSMSSHYNRNQTPPVVMVKDGKSRLIVKGDSLEDIVRNDI